MTRTPIPSVGAAPKARPRREWAGASFVAPFLLVFAFVIVAPLLYAAYLSMFRHQMIGGSVFVGFGNYITAITDPLFYSGLRRVLLVLAVQVPIMLGLSLFIALAIDSGRLRKAGVYRITLFLPYAVPSVVATLMWGYIYGRNFGLAGQLAKVLGLSAPDLLSNSWVLLSIGNIVTWSWVGYNMLILYSALRVIPTELYEAAEIDGAGPWRIARSIKIPALRPALLLCTIFSIIGILQLFNEPNVLKTLAPTSITSYYTPNMYIYNLALNGQQQGLAATVAVLLAFVIIVLAYFTQRGDRKTGGR